MSNIDEDLLDEKLSELKEYLLEHISLDEDKGYYEKLEPQTFFKAQSLFNSLLNFKFDRQSDGDVPYFVEIQDLSNNEFVINFPVMKLNTENKEDLTIENLQSARRNIRDNIKRYQDMEEKIFSLLAFQLYMNEAEENEDNNIMKP